MASRIEPPEKHTGQETPPGSPAPEIGAAPTPITQPQSQRQPEPQPGPESGPGYIQGIIEPDVGPSYLLRNRSIDHTN
ncbi:unnamed protein product [Aspergillus oryzae]|uniref:Unnamed protein product n=1 Tax=Aspergillus oryzae TaxID=5062 RepID=A0AAN4Z0I7_ASPOZ|nr:unnamed protein product [Aspergillus oryzae]